MRFDNETQDHLDTVKMHLRRMLRHTEDLLKSARARRTSEQT